MNVTLLARDLRQTDTRILLQSFLSQWIPLSLSVLGKYVLFHLRYKSYDEHNKIWYSTYFLTFIKKVTWHLNYIRYIGHLSNLSSNIFFYQSWTNWVKTICHSFQFYMFNLLNESTDFWFVFLIWNQARIGKKRARGATFNIKGKKQQLFCVNFK